MQLGLGFCLDRYSTRVRVGVSLEGWQRVANHSAFQTEKKIGGNKHSVTINWQLGLCVIYMILLSFVQSL